MTETFLDFGFGISIPEEWNYSSNSSARTHLLFVFTNLKVTLQYEQRTRSPGFSFPSRGMSALQIGHSNSVDISFLLEFRMVLIFQILKKIKALASIPS